MTGIQEAWRRLRERMRPRAEDAEVAEELRFHLDMAIARNRERGMSEEEARRDALARFGGVSRIEEEAREERGVPWLEQAGQDVRYAARTLRRSPTFAVALVLTLSLGIGAATAVFTVFDAVLLRSLPYPAPERLAFLGWDWGKGEVMPSLTSWQLAYAREHVPAFEGVTTYRTTELDLGERTRGATVRGIRVSEDFFEVIGIAPVTGRAFAAGEFARGAPRTVILGDAFWRREFAADRGALGRELRLGDSLYTIVGVMPPAFEFLTDPAHPDVVLPLPFQADPRDDGHNFMALVRVREGWPPERLASALAATVASMRAENPSAFASPGERFAMTSWRHVYVGELQQVLWVMLAAVALVLLIASVNAANLLVARGAARERELAVRTALGASRGRVVRQLVTEGLLVAAVSGVLGFAIGAVSLRALLALAPGALPRAHTISPDLRVFAVMFAVLGVIGVVFGLAAAAGTSRQSLALRLRDRSGVATGGARVRDLLILGETAFTVVLLACAGLLLASFAKLRAVDPGYSADGVLTVRLGRLPERYSSEEARAALQRDLLERFRRIEGVEEVGLTATVPMERGWNLPMTIAGRPDATEGAVELRQVTSGALPALRATLRSGRMLQASDEQAGAPRVAVVTESFARRWFPGEDPLGRRIELGRWKGEWTAPELEGGSEIVGVIADVRDVRLDRNPRRTVFIPMIPGSLSQPRFLIRGTSLPVVQAAVQREIAAADPTLAPPTIRSLREIVGASIAAPRFSMVLVSVFAGSALLLTIVGIYGVVSYAAQRRTAEMGVRIALGATPREVFRLIVGRGVLLVAGGVACGVAGALAATRLLEGLLYDVTPSDPVVLAFAVAALVVTALVACAVPARRATRVDPLVALRGE